MTDRAPALSTVLWRLITLCNDEVKASVARGDIPEISAILYVQQLTNFSNERGMLSWGTRGTATIRNELEPTAKTRLAENLKERAEFASTAERIVTETGADSTQVEGQLLQLVQRVVDESLEGAEHDQLVEVLALFLDDVQERPVRWHIRAWLDGVWLSTDAIEIADGVTIRNVTRAMVEEYLAKSGDNRFTTRQAIGPTTLELQTLGRTKLDAVEELEVLQSLLQFYRLVLQPHFVGGRPARAETTAAPFGCVTTRSGGGRRR